MRKEWKKITAIVLLIIIIAGFFIPVPYYISKPGGTEELAPLVTVDDHPNKKRRFAQSSDDCNGKSEYLYIYDR